MDRQTFTLKRERTSELPGTAEQRTVLLEQLLDEARRLRRRRLPRLRAFLRGQRRGRC